MQEGCHINKGDDIVTVTTMKLHSLDPPSLLRGKVNFNYPFRRGDGI